MRKLLVLAVAAAAAAVCGAADAVRYSTDNGVTWTWVGDFDAALEAVTSSAGVKNIIELDADTTWSVEHTLKDKDLTVRSHEELCVLKVTAAAAKLNVVGGNVTDRTVRFENLILDGGAVWTNPDNPSSTENSGVACGQLLNASNNSINQGYYIYIEFGDGFTLRNCQMTDDVVYVYTRSVFRLQDGALIANCRGGNSIVSDAAQSGGLCIDGLTAHASVSEGRAPWKLAEQRLPADGRRYEVAIPWSCLAPFKPAKGADLGMSMILNEDDGAGRVGFSGWFSGPHLKNLDHIGDLILEYQESGFSLDLITTDKKGD